jgi:hypothetical protein
MQEKDNLLFILGRFSNFNDNFEVFEENKDHILSLPGDTSERREYFLTDRVAVRMNIDRFDEDIADVFSSLNDRV